VGILLVDEGGEWGERNQPHLAPEEVHPGEPHQDLVALPTFHNLNLYLQDLPDLLVVVLLLVLVAVVLHLDLEEVPLPDPVVVPLPFLVGQVPSLPGLAVVVYLLLLPDLVAFLLLPPGLLVFLLLLPDLAPLPSLIELMMVCINNLFLNSLYLIVS